MQRMQIGPFVERKMMRVKTEMSADQMESNGKIQEVFVNAAVRDAMPEINRLSSACHY